MIKLNRSIQGFDFLFPPFSSLLQKSHHRLDNLCEGRREGGKGYGK